MPLCICYVLLSPTWGMHQYTADLANRQLGVGVEVHLITTAHYPRDRYAPGVSIHTPVAIMDTGFSLKGLRIWDLHGVRRTILDLKPNLVHFTGPHLWNPLLLCTLRRARVPTVHTLHDLHPHAGATYGRLLYLWNAYVRREANHLLVHGQCYLKELLRLGHISSRVTCTPLVFLPVSHAHEQALFQSPPAIQYGLSALFLGRLEIYKGLDMLIEAVRALDVGNAQVVVAGPGRLDRLGLGAIPANVDVRNRLVGDDETIDLFRWCGLVVLPYIEASQSALVATAYFFHKPVIVTDVGALPEYVVEGETGWVVPPRDPQALAEALNRALTDRARLVRMGQAGREWYERQRQAEEVVLGEMYAGLLCDR